MVDRENVHGHRSRLRDRFNAAPLAVADYELLELLLTYALPRKDTKAPAKELLRQFGSLQDVLAAAPERIAEIPGLGPGTATLWRILQECQARRANAPLVCRETFTSPEQVRELVCSRLGHLSKEEFWVLLVDNQNRLISFERIQQGTVDQTAAYPREILELALKRHASGLILVHNHPGGNPSPSEPDKQLTTRLSRISEDLGLRLLDHLIVAGNTFTSFRSLGIL